MCIGGSRSRGIMKEITQTKKRNEFCLSIDRHNIYPTALTCGALASLPLFYIALKFSSVVLRNHHIECVYRIAFSFVGVCA